MMNGFHPGQGFAAGTFRLKIQHQAAEKALEDAGISAEELDHIFVATLSGDYATPSTACQVQKGIGAVNAVCMDINAACSGFVLD